MICLTRENGWISEFRPTLFETLQQRVRRQYIPIYIYNETVNIYMGAEQFLFRFFLSTQIAKHCCLIIII